MTTHTDVNTFHTPTRAHAREVLNLWNARDRLDQRGWVERHSPRENRRTVNVLITADGRRAYVRNNRPFTAAVEDAVGARLSADEMAMLVSLLGRLSSTP